MKIFVIAFGNNRTPSTQYRLLQYMELFKSNGHQVTIVPKQKLSLKDLFAMAKADVVLSQKAILPIAWGWLIRLVCKRLVFEWDDAFWTRPGQPHNPWTQARIERRLQWWLKNADAVQCANNVINNYTLKITPHSQVLRMAIDLRLWQRKTRRQGPEIVLGWAGSHGNMAYLKSCETALETFLKKHPTAKLKILCGKRPDLSIPFEHIEWQIGSEHNFLEGVDIGLLPLPESDSFTLGKSPIKSLQYMAYGIPVVGNMTEGGSAEIAAGGGCLVIKDTQDWLAAFEKLTDTAFYAQLSQQALQNVQKNHDLEKVFAQYVAILKG